MKHFFRATAIGMAFLAMTLSVSAATFTVNTTNDTVDATPGDGICADAASQCSLRAAISEANALAGDDIITLPAGEYTQTLTAANEDLNAGGDWDIRSNITINGAGAATTILQAAASPGTATERVMENVLAANVVTINGVTLRHGFKTGLAAATTRGGGIRNVGTLTMNDSVVTLNTAAGAGGIRNERTITLNNVTVSNNACNQAAITCFGGGMYNTLAINATVTVNNSRFTGNTSAATATNGFGFGAGLGIESTTGFNLVITGSEFSNNVGNGNGASGGSNGNGLRMLPTAASTANITNTSFNNNSGTGGSSIQGSGIAVFTSGTGTLNGTLDGVTVNGNTGNAGGSGVFMNAIGGALNLTFRNSTISNNSGGTLGGGIALTNGGGTASSSITLDFINSTISGNAASNSGGGVFIEQPVAAIVTTNFNFSTIANNTAPNGGGIFRSTAGTVNLKNSIVGDNNGPTSAPDIAGTVNSQDYNHIENLSGATVSGTTTNNTTGDAQLGALADNGGPTRTHLPATSSPVVNTIPNGTNDCGTTVTTDQRGTTRPSSGACEKGSVELGASVTAATISGRVLSSSGQSLSGITVTLSGGGLPSPRTVKTGAFGNFSFSGVLTGQSYTLTVGGNKKYTFTPATRTFTLSADRPNENFTADAN